MAVVRIAETVQFACREIFTVMRWDITAIEGIVPTLQKIIATVNFDCMFDLKIIAASHGLFSSSELEVDGTGGPCVRATRCTQANRPGLMLHRAT
jgi:hypothetical protein